jgi:GntR family transcriptional regulator
MPALPPTVSDTAAPTLGAGASTPAFSPLYQQIKGLILQSLEAGEWRPGELIPSEMELAARCCRLPYLTQRQISAVAQP